jgi:hypothetical protein
VVSDVLQSAFRAGWFPNRRGSNRRALGRYRENSSRIQRGLIEQPFSVAEISLGFMRCNAAPVRFD